MLGEKREVVQGSSNKTAIAAVFFMVTSAGLLFVVGDTLYTNHLLAKPSFICTKIEQIGKNMDDVKCVQYTHQKYSTAAVAVNELITASNAVAKK